MINQELAQKLTEQRRTLGAESDELREELYRVRDVAKTEIERLQVELSSIKESRDEPYGWLAICVQETDELETCPPYVFDTVEKDLRDEAGRYYGEFEIFPLYLHPSPTPRGEK